MAGQLTTVGDRIRHARLSKGLDQGPVARAAGVTISALSQIETGKTRTPKPATLFKIADALGVEARYLVFGHVDRVAPFLSAISLTDARLRLRRHGTP